MKHQGSSTRAARWCRATTRQRFYLFQPGSEVPSRGAAATFDNPSSLTFSAGENREQRFKHLDCSSVSEDCHVCRHLPFPVFALAVLQ